MRSVSGCGGAAHSGRAGWRDFVRGGASRRAIVSAVHFMVAAHRSDEPASILLLDALGKRPFLTAGMHLGEGTGAAAGVALLDLALAPYREMVSFADIGMEAYQPQK